MTDTAERTAPPSSETLAAILEHLKASDLGPARDGLYESVGTGTRLARAVQRLNTIAIAVWILAAIQLIGLGYGVYVYSQVHHAAKSTSAPSY